MKKLIEEQRQFEERLNRERNNWAEREQLMRERCEQRMREVKRYEISASKVAVACLAGVAVGLATGLIVAAYLWLTK